MQQNWPQSIEKFLQNNIADHSVVPWTMKSTVYWSLITNYISQNLSLQHALTLKVVIQIFHSESSLVLQNIGIPLLSIIRILNTIQCMSPTVRTSYGDSNFIYIGEIIPNKLRNFMMRICQGNSCALQLWPMESYIVFSALQT